MSTFETVKGPLLLPCVHENKQVQQTRQQQNEGIISSILLCETPCVLGLLQESGSGSGNTTQHVDKQGKAVPLKFPQLAGSFTKSLLLPPPPTVIAHCFYNLGDTDSCNFHELPDCLNPPFFSTSFKEKKLCNPPLFHIAPRV